MLILASPKEQGAISGYLDVTRAIGPAHLRHTTVSSSYAICEGECGEACKCACMLTTSYTLGKWLLPDQ